MGSTSQEIKIVSRKGEVLSMAAIQELKDGVKCKVMLKGEADEELYRAAIDRYNKAWVAEAGIIVFCQTEIDIAACLAYVQKYDLDMTIRCGGHSVYGASSIDGGLVIDLREMKRVSIDEENLTITAQGGCQAIDLETPLQKLGLSVVLGAVSDTGIGGLTLGGGSGFLTGQYGLVIDNLLAAKIVLANGSVVSASEEENPDLFWAIRGGGSNFGVVTEFVYRVHKQGDVFFGPLIFTPDKLRPLLELIENLRIIVESEEAAGKLAIFVVLSKGPGMNAVHPSTLIFYDGPEEVAKSLVAPLFQLEPAIDRTRMSKYADTTAPAMYGPMTHQHYATNNGPLFDPDVDLLEGVANDLGLFLEKYGQAAYPTKFAIEIRSYAKSSSVDPKAMALRARVPALMMVFEVQHDGSIADSNTVMRTEAKSLMDKVRAKVAMKHPESSRFFNANISSGTEKVQDMFGENLGRLRELKRKYDPDFVFRKWYPIQPADA